MTKEQIKAEHDRLRQIVFEGAPKGVAHSAMNIDGRWEWFFEMSLRVGVGGHYQVSKEPIESINQPETTLSWRDTLIEREATHEGI